LETCRDHVIEQVWLSRQGVSGLRS
jgi:hypothetical protein